jgi:hypothetical protein
MAAVQYDYEHQKLRKALIAMLAVTGPWPCPRCGAPMWVFDKLDLGHVVDVVNGGFGGPRRLEHAKCNQSAGGKLGGRKSAAKREAIRVAQRTPAEQAAHDHRVSVRMRREARQAREAMNAPGREW